MRRKDNTIKLGDAINQLLKQEKLDIKMSRFAIKNAWKDIAGELIAKHTLSIYFDDRKNIFVELDSDALKNELSYNKNTLLTSINTFCGYELVTQLIIK